ncbi:MAG: ABC transporter permease, partial [Rectinemataceae bacterium]
MPPEDKGTGQATGFRAILFIAFRWMQAGRGGAHRSRLLFASLGIAAGIATLLAVLSVMNGFQRHYMETLIETSSFHVRADVRPGLSQEAIKQLLASLSEQPEVRSVLPFAETSMIVTDTRFGRQTVAKVLIVDFEQLANDAGFIGSLGLDRAAIARLGDEGAMIGVELARQLQIEQNSSILLKGAAVSEEEGLVPYAAQVAASTIFKSGYYDVDAGLILLSAQTAAREGVPYVHPTTLGIKLLHAEGDARFLMKLGHSVDGTLQHIESWREYNRSF